MMRRLVLFIGVLSFVGGCVNKTFNLSFPDNQLKPLKQVLAKVEKKPLAPINGQPVVYLVTQKPTKLVAYDLKADKVVWEVSANVRSRIIVGKGRLFHSNGKQMVARRASDGQTIWTSSLNSKARLLGVDVDQTSVYYSMEFMKRKGGGDAGYVVALDATNGKMRWKQTSDGRIGAPAARNGYVFVPLRYQSIAILEGKKGEEVTRVRSTEEALLWVRSTPGGVYFGGKNGIYRLDEKAISGTRSGSTFVSAALPDSVRPAYWWDGYNAALSGYTAYDRNRLLWRLDGQPPIFTDNAIYVHNYRFFFAFSGATAKAGRDQLSTDDTLGKRKTENNEGKKAAVIASDIKLKTDKQIQGGSIEATDDEQSAEGISHLKWAFSYPRVDVVASYHSGGALILVSVRGDVVVVDLENGMIASKKALNLKIQGATFDAVGYAPANRPKGKMDLEKVLTEMIWDPDRRFGEVKLFGIQQLSQLRGEKIAKALVNIVTRPGISKKIYQRAGDMIVSRHDESAVPLYLDVLNTHTDFLKGTQAKAVDIMARALGDLRVKKAIKPLLTHLKDPETSIDAIDDIAKALERIGDKKVVEPLRDFLLTYRCEPAFQKHPKALNAVANALLTLGGEEERQLLAFVSNDSHSLKPLRVYLDAALRQVRQEATAKKQAKPSK